MSPDRKLLNALQEADDAGQVAYTRHLCEKVLGNSPDHGPTLIRYASSLIELSLYEDASRVLDHAEAVVSEKILHLVSAQRGHLLGDMGDFLASEAHYLKAHDLDTNDATYLIYAGASAFRRGDIRRAEELARNATACSEGFIDEAYFNLGGYLLAQMRYDEARECYLKALLIDPDYTIAKNRLEDVDRVLKDKGE